MAHKQHQLQYPTLENSISNPPCQTIMIGICKTAWKTSVYRISSSEQSKDLMNEHT